MATFNQENIHLAFQYLLPLSEYHLFSDDYADVEWMDSRTQPTKAAVDTAIPLALAVEKWKDIRKTRDALLAQSDWMANSDVTMSDAWKTYRKALRDLPASQADPDNIVWPTAPE